MRTSPTSSIDCDRLPFRYSTIVSTHALTTVAGLLALLFMSFRIGFDIGIGTVCSVVMITVVLPSALYLLDKFVLKLSLKKK